ncbi:MAG: YchJ family protein [Fibrobacter sp.]|jgi:SEC-C motif-containing protein|nr:YchJ family protein [Fibrobacter sp.]
MSEKNCPCLSGKLYSECCEPIIKKQILAPTPEALMRSRYTAYAMQEISWLKDSLEKSQRKDFDEKSVEDWSKNSEWMGIEIKQTKTEEEKNIGWVEFIARFKQGNVTRNHHELAEFHRINGEWFFYDGRAVKQETVKKETPDTGRNDPCPCGSGKKFKKCCGA